jgi:hypothetical protein
MAIDEKYTALMNADIDGDIQPDEKAELEAFLAASEAGRALQDELRSLCATLDAEDMIDTPPHLRHVVMNALPDPRPNVSPAAEAPGFWQALFAVPALRYTATFAAGIILAVAIVDSAQIQQSAFNEVTGLVGTMSDAGDIAPVASTVINKAAVAGTITLRRADPILIIDFDLSTNGPIDIVASYDDKSVWFNGFAQLESTGTSISADGGQIRIQVDGKRRYAVYLHNAGSHKLSINLEFFSNGEPVHEAVLEYDQT